MNDKHYDLAEKDEVFGNLNRLQRILSQLDDRGLILSLAAFAEEALGDLIRSFMITGESSRQLLDGFNAPLGSLSARIKIAYALGLVTKRQYEDLERLRKMRNEFAHRWEPVSFADPSIAAHVSALHFSSLDDKFPDTPLEKVRTSLETLLLELRAVTNQINKRNWGAKLIGHHIIAGVAGDTDQQIEVCRRRLIELADELRSASGDRRRFLLAARWRWEGKLEIVRLNAPKEKDREIRALQEELAAWNAVPEN